MSTETENQIRHDPQQDSRASAVEGHGYRYGGGKCLYYGACEGG